VFTPVRSIELQPAARDAIRRACVLGGGVSYFLVEFIAQRLVCNRRRADRTTAHDFLNVPNVLGIQCSPLVASAPQ
jgi:hypothetical protein